MIKTILIDNEPTVAHLIKSDLQKHCPQISLCGSATSCEEASLLIKEYSPSLVLIDSSIPKNDEFYTFQTTELSEIETVFLSPCAEFAVEAFKYQASGFVLKPIKLPELVLTLKKVEKRIEDRRIFAENIKIMSRLSNQDPSDHLIGIPTMEGFDFLPIQDIIRCEGFQRCSRIITTDRSDIISSYHIGVFIKRLEPYRFFATHKSHLINLFHIRKYLKEGSIKMSDGVFVPVAKRRKQEFLKLMMLSR